jgi:hypothetical protein
MAVNVDTVYQRVLAIANKEQRGYITPIEFNLYANQAQMSIYEGYFYDLDQALRARGNETFSSDKVDIIEQKLQIFEKVDGLVQIARNYVVVNDAISRGLRLPTYVYRVKKIERQNAYGTDSPLMRTTLETLDEALLGANMTSSRSQPEDYSTSFSTAIDDIVKDRDEEVPGTFFSPGADCEILNISEFLNVRKFSNRRNLQKISPNLERPIANISNNIIRVVDNHNGQVVAPTLIIYYRIPKKVEWGYNVVGENALYDSTKATNFQLHESEAPRLVYEILQLAGISMGKELYTIGSQEEAKTVQQQKI